MNSNHKKINQILSKLLRELPIEGRESNRREGNKILIESGIVQL